jgi:hypothetical protein
MNNKTMIGYAVYELVYKKQYNVSHTTRANGTRYHFIVDMPPTPEFNEYTYYDDHYLEWFDKPIDLKFMIGERVLLNSGKAYTIVAIEHMVNESNDCAHSIVLYVEGNEKLLIENVESKAEVLVLVDRLNNQENM